MPSQSCPLSLPDALPIFRRGVGRRDAGRLREPHVPGRSADHAGVRLAPARRARVLRGHRRHGVARGRRLPDRRGDRRAPRDPRSEEHTSELQSLRHLVCRPSRALFPYPTLFRSFVAAWAVATLGGFVNRTFLADPLTMLASGWRLLVVHGFYEDIGVTVWRVGGGFLIAAAIGVPLGILDRKSTRLNSSHLGISYAVPVVPSFPTRRSSDLSSRRGPSRRWAAS